MMWILLLPLSTSRNGAEHWSLVHITPLSEGRCKATPESACHQAIKWQQLIWTMACLNYIQMQHVTTPPHLQAPIANRQVPSGQSAASAGYETRSDSSTRTTNAVVEVWNKTDSPVCGRVWDHLSHTWHGSQISRRLIKMRIDFFCVRLPATTGGKHAYKSREVSARGQQFKQGQSFVCENMILLNVLLGPVRLSQVCSLCLPLLGLSAHALDTVRGLSSHAANSTSGHSVAVKHAHTFLPACFPETAGSTAIIVLCSVCRDAKGDGGRRTEIDVAQASDSSSPQTVLTNESVEGLTPIGCTRLRQRPILLALFFCLHECVLAWMVF